MFDSVKLIALADLPLVLILAWLAGEWGQRWLRLPRIVLYALVGLLCGPLLQARAGADLLAGLSFLANFALGLALFELGYRINPRWLLDNPWIALTGVLDATLTFGFVSGTAQAFGLALPTALALGALAVSTSPVAVVRVCNDLRSSGQVTERVLHLCALGCVLSVLLLKASLGFWLASDQSDLPSAIWNAGVASMVAVGCGILFGLGFPVLLRSTSMKRDGATVPYALAVLLLAVLTQSLSVSPLLAAITFGMVSRRHRFAQTCTQRNFGDLGEFLTVFLFVYVASLLDPRSLLDSAAMACAFVGVRLCCKLCANVLLAHPAGTTLKKGALTGLALSPLSAFAVLLIDHFRSIGFAPAAETFQAISGMVLILEIGGPLLAQAALIAAGETRRPEGE